MDIKYITVIFFLLKKYADKNEFILYFFIVENLFRLSLAGKLPLEMMEKSIYKTYGV